MAGRDARISHTTGEYPYVTAPSLHQGPHHALPAPRSREAVARHSTKRMRTPLGVLARGLVAGLAGTAVMTAYQELVSSLRHSDSDASGSQQPADWSKAPAPAQVGKRLLEGLFQFEVSPDYIPLLTNTMHWTYGTVWGGVYGLVQETVAARPVRHGLTFGTVVWGMSYVEMVPLGLYQPPWEYPAKTLAIDLSYHLVYGLGVAGAYAAGELLFDRR